VTLDYAACRPDGAGEVQIAQQQVAVERALRHSAEQAREDLDGMIAITAHELRAPLTVLLCQAQLLQHRLEAREGADSGDRRAVDVLVAQSLRLSQLISALLDGASINQGELLVSATTLDLGALVRRAVHSLQPTLPSHMLRLSADITPLWVKGDAMRLEQVLQNLIQNAVKYSPAGGEVVIAMAPAGHQVRITVIDQGSGITASARPYLFQRFVRAKRESDSAVPGLGLGLYICKAIMDLHGGSIEVESAVGAGCTFTLLLPRIQC
jgi:signal transduction histidine kinase